jgi:ABC-2 type transport system permease protein
MMIQTLLAAKLNIVKGSLRSTQEGRGRAPFFLLLSSIFCVMLFRGSYWLTSQALELQPVGDLLVQKLVSITFLIFIGLLTFSNVVTSFSAFYLADDLDFLMKQPIPGDELFTSRYLEAMIQSSWVIFFFGTPAFVAVGVAMSADWSYYAALPLVLIPFMAIPTGFAALFALGITNMLVASRMRDALMFMGMIGFGVLFVLIRAMQPEKLLSPEQFDSIGQLMTLLSTPPRSWLPSDWCVNVLMPLLHGQRDQVNLWSLGLLYSTPLSLYFITAWAHRRFYWRGWCRAQEGRHGASLITLLRDWAVRRSTTGQGAWLENLERMKDDPSEMNALTQLIRKDRFVFTRDASQWSNLLVIFALMSIYLVNYKYFQIASEVKIFGEVGLYFFNLAACGFVVVALSGRFLYPSISLEGRSFWLLMQAPISMEKILVGKWLGAIFPVLLVGQAMIWISNLLVTQNLFHMIAGSLFVVVITLAVAAMAVGMGSVYPQFHNPNAASISSSFGAVIFMITSIIMIVAMIFFSFRFFTVCGKMYMKSDWKMLAPETIIGLTTSLLIPAIASYLSIRIGASSLRKRL